MEIKVTFNLLPVLAVFISLAAWYIPRFKTWYSALPPENKQLTMAGFLLATTVGVALLSYFGFLHVYAGPTWREWVWYPGVDFVIALIANAGTYVSTNKMLTRQTKLT